MPLLLLLLVNAIIAVIVMVVMGIPIKVVGVVIS